MASAHDVPIVDTPKGVRVTLGKLYMYPDGHANLTFEPVLEKKFEGAQPAADQRGRRARRADHARQAHERHGREEAAGSGVEV